MSERGALLFMELIFKPGLVFGLAVVVSSLLTHHSASLRHRLWAAAFLVALSLPLIRTLVPPLRLRVLAAAWAPARGATVAVSPNEGRAITENGRPRVAEGELLRGERSPATTSPSDWENYVAFAWGFGAFALLARLIAAYSRANRIAMRATRPTNERLRGREFARRGRVPFARAPELRLSRHVATPIVIGILRPVVILPERAT